MEREDVMRKVQALMDRAESTTFEAERDSCIAKADSLMAAYAIQQFELDMAKPVGSREKPEIRIMPYGEGDYELRSMYSQLFGSLVRHVGAMYVDFHDGGYRVIGFKSDLDWLDWLLQSVRLHMLSTMAPKPNPDMKLEENIVLLKETGLKWQDIWTKLYPVFHQHPKVLKFTKKPEEIEYSWNLHAYDKIGELLYPKTVPRPFGVWCTGVYTKHCKENGLDRTYASPTVYRRSFMEGYLYRINARLREMAEARGQAAVGKELVLANKKEDLLELLYELKPNLRPHPDDCDCDQCHRCADKKCKRPRCVEARKPVRYSRARYVDPKYDSGAARNGARAANSADLMGGRHNVTPNRREIG